MRYEGKKDEMEWRALGIKKKRPKIVRVQNYDVTWKINYPDTEYNKGLTHSLNIKTNGTEEDAIREVLAYQYLRYDIEIYNEHHDEKISLANVEILEVKKNEFLEL